VSSSPAALRAVIVEDVNTARAATAEVIEAVCGGRVVAAFAGESEATHWLHGRDNAWDLLVVDLMLADGNGFGVLRRYATAHPQGTIVVVSGYVTPVIARRCIQLGAAAAFHRSEWSEFVQFLEGLAAPQRTA
jgi:DNA-binding NarL/FixJ family response regulator